MTLAHHAPSLRLIKALSKTNNSALTQGILRGVEKEGLRVLPNGTLSLTPHSINLGSALTHPHITTDFSESLLEYITAPTHLDLQLQDDLTQLQSFSYQHLGNEVIWPMSMPCALPSDEQIPVAQYGTSNRAKMKTVYREGLGLRYGRTMQTVAGLHYNFSLPRAFWALIHHQELSTQPLDTFITDKYFHLIRNFRRYYWLLIYLFGASPAVDASFVKDRQHNLVALAPNTLGLPYATALRMGNLGYQSSAQSSLFVCYNTLKSYTTTLGKAIHTPYPEYENLGNGKLKQLNTSLLQIENEFYSAIRPKRTAHNNETALTALCNRGVEYLEVRCLDLDPFEASGIAHSTVKFLDVFLVYCLLKPSPACDKDEFIHTQDNQQRVVTQGRKANLGLITPTGDEISLKNWGLELTTDMTAIAELLDKNHSTEDYSAALTDARNKLLDPALTPSAKIADAHAKGISHIQFGLQQANKHKNNLAELAKNEEYDSRYQEMTQESLRLLAEEESQVQLPFDEYLANYYQQYQTCCDKAG
ncbi:MAG: glutamate--cysteine ligase [Marinagarivorans sp.]|nr:glutamate--cysteine ligase [Marinagarivorans sp.]